MPDPYFLSYQSAWLNDQSRLKIWKKSRRIGATYVQAYEDVKDASRSENPMDVWFSSADESAAKEYILYCAMWAEVFDLVASDLGEVVIDSKNDIKALVIQFANGKRINGLSSNPKAFRSKGGKLVLDEFAFHGDPEALWKAAAPVITWGYPVRILSTFNGKGNRYYRMVDEAEKAKPGTPGAKWALHTTTIIDAVDAGLADKVKGTPQDNAGRKDFIEECRAIAGDEETFLQEYMCEPVDEATAWLPWNLITSVESEFAGKPELYEGGPAYLGVDIGRRRDLTVFWVLERVGDVLWTREVVSLKKATFAEQDAERDRLFAYYKIGRSCMDETGLGMKPVEDAKERYGEYTVEGVWFTGPVKQNLATLGKQAFEDRVARIPALVAIRNSHHAVRKTTTDAGNPRFDADRSEVGHADEFWAHMLALHAAEGNGIEYGYTPVHAAERDAPRDGMAGRVSFNKGAW